MTKYIHAVLLFVCLPSVCFAQYSDFKPDPSGRGRYGPYSLDKDYSCNMSLLDASTYTGGERDIWVDCDDTLTANVSVHPNIHLIFEKGNVITLGAYNLTIPKQIDAGGWQIFNQAGAGTVSFSAGAVLEVCPEWWGAVVGSGDDTDAIQDAINSLSAGVVKFSAGEYLLSTASPITLKSYVTLEGVQEKADYGTTIYHNPPGLTYAFYGYAVDFIAMRDFAIKGNNVAAGAVYLDGDGPTGVYCSSSTFDHMIVQQYSNAAAVVMKFEYALYVSLSRCFLSGYGAHNIVQFVGKDNVGRITNCDLSGASDAALVFESEDIGGVWSSNTMYVEQTTFHDSKYGIYVQTVSSLTAIKPFFEMNTTADVYIGEGFGPPASADTGPMMFIGGQHNGNYTTGASVGYDIHGKNVTIMNPVLAGDYRNTIFVKISETSEDNLLIGGAKSYDGLLGYTPVILEDLGTNNSYINFMGEYNKLAADKLQSRTTGYTLTATDDATDITLTGSNGDLIFDQTAGDFEFRDDIHGPVSGCTTATTLTIDSGPAHCTAAVCGVDLDADLDGLGGCAPGEGALNVWEETAVGGSTTICEPGAATDFIVAFTPSTFTYGDDIRLCIIDGGGGPGPYVSILLPAGESCTTLNINIGAAGVVYADANYFSFNSGTCTYDFTPDAGLSLVAGWNSPPTITTDSVPTYIWSIDSAIGNIDTEGTIHADGNIDTDANLTVDGTVGIGTSPLNYAGMSLLFQNDLSSASNFGLTFGNVVTLTQDRPLNNAYGIYGYTNLTDTPYDMAFAEGGFFGARQYGSGSATLIGVVADAEHLGSGVVPEMRGLEVSMFVTGTGGSVTEAHYLDLYDYSWMFFAGTNTVTDLDIAHIGNMTGPRITGSSNGFVVDAQNDPSQGYFIDTGWWTRHRDGIEAWFGNDLDGSVSSEAAGALDVNATTTMNLRIGTNIEAILTNNSFEIVDGTLKTAAGNAYDFQGYTIGAPTPDGYLVMVVDGTTYHVAVDQQ